MADKKPKRPEFNTPRATFSYPKLLVPDTKFNPEGVLGVKLVVSPADAEAIRKNAEGIMAGYIANDIATTEEAAKKNPKVKKTLEAKKAAGPFKMSIEDEVDEAGAETGNKLVNFKQKATVKFKDKKGVEQTFKATIPIFDAKGQRIPTHDKSGNLLPNAIRIFGGTEGKVRYQIIPAFIVSSGTYHATLRPIAVQIIKLVSGGGERDAGGFGFEAEEGYEADTSGFTDESTASDAQATTEGADAAAGY